MFTKERLDNHLTHYTVNLIRHLIKSEQAKNCVVNFISEVLHVDKPAALRYYKDYQEWLEENNWTYSSVGRTGESLRRRFEPD